MWLWLGATSASTRPAPGKALASPSHGGSWDDTPPSLMRAPSGRGTRTPSAECHRSPSHSGTCIPPQTALEFCSVRSQQTGAACCSWRDPEGGGTWEDPGQDSKALFLIPGNSTVKEIVPPATGISESNHNSEGAVQKTLRPPCPRTPSDSQEHLRATLSNFF